MKCSQTDIETCNRKAVYEDEWFAHDRLAKLIENTEEDFNDAKRLRVYRCRCCGKWHIGHVKEKE